MTSPSASRGTIVSIDAYKARQTEAEFQAAVMAAAQTLGWLVVHIRHMLGNDPGIPDLLLWRGERYLLIELKTERGVVSAAQRRWHAMASRHGVAVQVWRPSDWGLIEATLKGEIA